jgi:NADH dehydrogenase
MVGREGTEDVMRNDQGSVATVFGGSGFIGRYVVKRLAGAGHVVRVAVRDPEGALFLKPMGGVGQVVPMRCDIGDAAQVAAAVAGADMVVSLVGILFEAGGQTFRKIQAEAPGSIARAAAAAGVKRLVHVSAIGADAGSEAEYARTKAAGEQAVLAAFPSATILRPSIVFGPEDGFFNRFGAMASLLPALPLIGGGHTRFQPVYVGDVADAVMAALARDDVFGRTYELGGPKVWSFRELLEFILRETGRRRALVHVGWGMAMLQGRLGELLPTPPITRDQVNLLRRDNVVADGAPGLSELGIQPKAIEAIVPAYLARFRRRGVRRDTVAA